MAFPTIPTVAAGRVLTGVQADTTATRTFPSLTGLTKNAGDLLIAIVVGYNTSVGSNAAFSGWTGGFTEFHDSATNGTMPIGIAYKWSTGSETGTIAVTQAATITGHAGFLLLSIPGAHATTPPEAGGRASGTTAAADPASFDPAGWAAEDTLWIVVGGSGETGTGGAFQGLAGAGGGAPTNYTDDAYTGISADVVGGVEAGAFFRQLNASSEDAGPIAPDISNARNAAVVIAVRPVAAAIDLAPSPVAVTPAVPAPAIGLTLAFAPAPVAAAPAVPAPTLGLSLALAPAAVAVSPAIPSPTLETPLALAPDPVAVIAAVPVSELVADQILAPDPVPTILTVPTPALGLALALAPDPVPATPAVPSPTIDSVLALAPSPVTVALAVPPPELGLAINLAPDPVPVTLAVPAAVLDLILAFTPDAVAALTIVADSEVTSGAQDTELTPDPVAVALTTPAPALDTPLDLSPAPVALALAVPSPTVGAVITLEPAPVSIQLAVPTPQLALAIAFAPAAVRALLGVPTPTVTAEGSELVSAITRPVVAGAIVIAASGGSAISSGAGTLTRRSAAGAIVPVIIEAQITDEV